MLPFGKIIKGQDSNVLGFYFMSNSSLLLKDYRGNAEALKQLEFVLSDSMVISTLDSIEIEATASPDGGVEYNMNLAKQRGESIKSFIRWKCSHIPAEKIKVRFSPIDWETVKEVIREDTDFPCRLQTLSAISSVASPETIDWRLRKLAGGQVWSYLVTNYFWRYTSAVSATYYLNPKRCQMLSGCDLMKITTPLPKVVSATKNDMGELKQLTIAYQGCSEENPASIIPYKPLFAMKTNLLFDLATLINFEFEIPVKKKWSIAGEWIFPWWVQDNGRANSKRNRLQLLNGTLEGRYWFGDRTKKSILTGWFAGVYAGAGLYDFEYKAKGYQGEFFLMGGVSGGFAHTINKRKNLRMEYSIGLGYIKTNFRKYEAIYDDNLHCDSSLPHSWHPITINTGQYSWIGPTRLKVSLVWLLEQKTKRRNKR